MQVIGIVFGIRKFPPVRLRITSLISLACLPVAAATVSYSGKVVDKAGAALPWALIRVDGGGIIGQSGADGSFSLTGDAATVFSYGDPRPSLLGLGARETPDPNPPRYLLTGRRANAAHPAALVTLRAPQPPAIVIQAIQPPNMTRIRLPEAAESEPPQPPSLPAKQASGSGSLFSLSVSMANYLPGAFPQAEATAKGLTLALERSPTDTAHYAAEKKLCLDTINALRAKVGAKAVAWSVSLEAFADQGARYDAGLNSAHAHFSAFSKRAVPADAENAVPGWPIHSFKTVSAVVAQGAKMMWDEGPGGGHYENIKGNHTLVGCGIYVTPEGGVWVIHDFK